MKQYGLARVSVGFLPEWYDEELHDPYLENQIEQWFGKVAERVEVEYVYSGKNTVTLYDHDDNPVNERITDLDFAFDKARLEEW
jgi:hypothetical protein